MNLRSVFGCLLILVIISSCSCFYIPVRLIAKFIPAGAMYGGVIATNLISKAQIPTIHLGDHHHEAVHLYPSEHTHKLTSHGVHVASSDHHVVSHGHHGHHGHHGLHGLHGHHGHHSDFHLPRISLGLGGGGGGGGLLGGFGGLHL